MAVTYDCMIPIILYRVVRILVSLHKTRSVS